MHFGAKERACALVAHECIKFTQKRFKDICVSSMSCVNLFLKDTCDYLMFTFFKDSICKLKYTGTFYYILNVIPDPQMLSI